MSRPASSPSLPPDRSHVTTEHRHPKSINLDALDTLSMVQLFCDDHCAVIDALQVAKKALAELIDDLANRMRDGGRLVYIGAGTSGRLGVLDASECPPTFQSDPHQVVGLIAGGDAALRKSSESREDDPIGAAEALGDLQLTARDTVIGIAAGGTTPYVRGALLIAHRAGARSVLLTCTSKCERPEGCDEVICLDTGPELLTGSTRLKAGSATKLALNIISTGVFIRLGKVYSNLMIDVRATNAKLVDRALRILIELCPELSREQASDLLMTRAGGNLKQAIVMQRLDVDAAMAQALLTQNAGSLRTVLGDQ